MANKLSYIIPGFVLATAVGFAAYYLSQFNILLDSLLVGIVLGVLVRFFLRDCTAFFPGLEFASRLFIPLGIILYGAKLEFQKLLEVPLVAWFQLTVGALVVFAVAIIFAKRLSVGGKVGILSAVGTAICGASAIVITAPAIKATKKDIGNALIAVVFWGIIGAFLYPFIQKLLMISTDAYTLFSASTLQTTGSIKTAMAPFGEDALNLALSVKVARTALIIPILAVLVVIFRRVKVEDTGLDAGQAEAKSPFFINIALVGFVVMGFLFSLVPNMVAYAGIANTYATILWTLAMASIGLLIDARGLLKELGRPLVLGFLLWMAVITMFVLGYWIAM